MNIPSCGSGIPNWQDRDAYPDSYDDISEGNWRWEFLRRDPEYQRVWSRGTDLRNAEGILRTPGPEDFNICLKVFRLRFLSDPFGNHPISVQTQLIDPSGAITLNPPDVQGGHGSHLVMASFDLNRPLKPQLDNIYETLKYQQRSRKQELVIFRKHKNKWPLYLRMLDAQAQGNPRAMEIFNHLKNEAYLHDKDAHPELDVGNPATLISDWQKAAIEVRIKAIRYL